ncbi:MAG TPA: type II toxin-antitoxin system VapB family antitoxin, partial [Thermoanaerobaculia bacterium]|nr:type II toxin-antitoxin system VapB family antitoxin [Thermoanaerobaculia bacterium]
MALSIQNPEAEQLARELADRTGESLTEAVVNSLRERLQRERKRARSPRLRD